MPLAITFAALSALTLLAAWLWERAPYPAADPVGYRIGALWVAGSALGMAAVGVAGPVLIVRAVAV